MKTHDPLPKEYVDRFYSRGKKEKPKTQEEEPKLFGPQEVFQVSPFHRCPARESHLAPERGHDFTLPFHFHLPISRACGSALKCSAPTTPGRRTNLTLHSDGSLSGGKVSL